MSPGKALSESINLEGEGTEERPFVLITGQDRLNEIKDFVLAAVLRNINRGIIWIRIDGIAFSIDPQGTRANFSPAASVAGGFSINNLAPTKKAVVNAIPPAQ